MVDTKSNIELKKRPSLAEMPVGVFFLCIFEKASVTPPLMRYLTIYAAENPGSYSGSWI